MFSGLYWYTNNLISEITSGFINSTDISIELITPQLYLNNSTGILIDQPENIWRLNSDYINVNIGYEAFNPNCLNLLITDYLKTTQDNYYIGVIKFICSYYTTKVSNTKDLYITGFKSINCVYETQAVSLFTNDDKTINDDIGLILLSKTYPKCELNTETHNLEISTIITTLGKTKNYLATITNLDELNFNTNAMNELTLLKNSIAFTEDEAISNLTGLILEDSILSAGINELNYNIENNTASKLTDLTWTDNWEFNFYENGFLQYITNQDLSMLKQYNESISSGLNSIVNFAPVVTQCLIEPLKIIFNFGTNNYPISNIFDMDIKVLINDETERNKAVGWRCGYKQTKYLNWQSGDNIEGGPEVVYVDIDTYKFYHVNKSTLEILVNACWFQETQVESINPTINIVWKGYLYTYPVENVLTNTDCCDNLILRIQIDLNNNTIKCDKQYFVGLVTTYNEDNINIESNNFNVSLGYIKMYQSEYEEFNQMPHLKEVELVYKNNIKKYYLYTHIADQNLDVVKTNLENSWYITYNNTNYNGKLYLKDSIDLIWTDQVILNIDNKLYTVYNYKQEFIDFTNIK